MDQNPYVRFQKGELILRDYLAVDRTNLANERTFMAYIRTSLALAAGGGSLIHFLDSVLTNIGGGLLLALAAVILAWGLQRFIWYKRRLKNCC
ncbi:MAG: DUF202 domain-containing protein [Dehalococcoidales bacterium]|nr:DUF202 domain-containing protein [Dehalococcoidales bacterium]